MQKSDIFRIYVVTDTHLGFKERDPIRQRDTLYTFRESLLLSNALKADFIVHSGDLFDVQRPSQQCLMQAMTLMKEYLIGKDPIRFQVLQRQTRTLNFESEDINVKMPIFIIHGNHDPPIGQEGNEIVSVLDILSVAGFVNDIGQTSDLDCIVLRPILLQKGDTKIALYGLGHIRDERMNRIFSLKKISFEEPPSPDFFSILLFHQNRFKGNLGGAPAKSCVHEEMLPSFLDLVIWGHEHDCSIEPQDSLKGDYHIIQPGSTVVTSLCKGDATFKRNCVVEVCGKKFRTVSFPLLTTRPFIFDEVKLQALLQDQENTEAAASVIWQGLETKVDAMVAEQETFRRERFEDWSSSMRRLIADLHYDFEDENPDMIRWVQTCLYDHRSDTLESFLETLKQQILSPLEPSKSSLPLIRLRVESSENALPDFSLGRFGALYVNKIANTEEILLFHKIAGRKSAVATGTNKLKELPALEIQQQEGNQDAHELIFYHVNERSSLELLVEPDLNEAVKKYVERADSAALETIIAKHLREVQNQLKKSQLSALTDRDALRSMVLRRSALLRQECQTANRMLCPDSPLQNTTPAENLPDRVSLPEISSPPPNSSHSVASEEQYSTAGVEPSTARVELMDSLEEIQESVEVVEDAGATQTTAKSSARRVKKGPSAKAKPKARGKRNSSNHPAVADLIGDRKRSTRTFKDPFLDTLS